jgi:cell division protein FtsL
MSKFYNLNKLNTEKHTLNKKPKIRRGSFIIYIVIFLIILSSLAYVIQVNSIAVKGFKIEELRKRVNQLQMENEKLEIKVAEMQSMSKIEEVANQLGLVKSEKVEYLKGGSSMMVVR